MNADNAVEASNLTKLFGDLVAVDHISFQVRKGEILGFLGPNGAGKTTTVRMLTGVLKPDAGTASITGYDIQREPIKAKQVMGIVPEMSNAYIDLSAWQNLMFLGELYGVPKKRRVERANVLLKMLGLYGRKDHLVKVFSKGMKQRLIICMALLNDPQILFLDEPTVGLDVQSARMIRGMIHKLNQEGTAVFLTTHNMEEANQLCDRIAVINHGRIAVVGAPEKLRRAVKGLQSVEVSFSKPVKMQSLSKLPRVNEVKKMGDKLRLYTNEPNDVVCSLVDYAKSNDLKLVALNTLVPSLEDVYIKLIESS